MTTVETTTTMNVYVPICYVREKYEHDSDTIGVFLNKSDAVNALLQYLIDNRRISSINSSETVTIRKGKCYEEEYFRNIVNGDFENLINVCKQYNDTDFNDGWKIRIDNFTVM